MSDTTDLIALLHKQHQTGQDKFTYFLLAAAGAAIAFAVQKTEGLLLSWWLLPVAFATLCWGVSFYFGCKNLVWVQTSIFANLALFAIAGRCSPKAAATSPRVPSSFVWGKNGIAFKY